MSNVFPGRYTADIEGDFVVFLIGMRANRPWKLRKTLMVARAMPPILRDLEAHPEKGCIGTRQALLSPIATLAIQFWRDFESLERYAKDDMVHSEPWKRFFKVVGLQGDVGIWHETFQVRAGEYESVYGNMPRHGLAAAAGHRPLGSASRARERLGVDG